VGSQRRTRDALDDTSLNHLVVKIVSLSGPLSNTSEDGVTSVSLGDVVDELLNLEAVKVAQEKEGGECELERKAAREGQNGEVERRRLFSTHEHSLSDSGSTEKSNLSSSSVRSEEIDDLDSGLENLSGGRLVDEGRSVGVNGRHLDSDDGWGRGRKRVRKEMSALC